MEDSVPVFVAPLETADPVATGAASASHCVAASAKASSDEHLIASFAAGSEEAFAELFSRYKQMVFGFFRRRVDDHALAEELAQETFIAVLRAASRYKPRASFRSYLYGIGFRVLRSHQRKAAFRGMFSVRQSVDREVPVENTADAQILLRQVFAKLDDRERELLLLREYEQLSYGEIAELLDLPLNTVRSRLFRARMALRDLLSLPATKTQPNDAGKFQGSL